MKSLIITITLVLSSVMMFAQNTAVGMHYQAIARDAAGELIANEQMVVKVEMMTMEPEESVLYSEMHSLSSNTFGLLNLSIGEGKKTGGEFDEIPWSDQNVWARISIKKSSDDDFKIVTSSKLYSVPYAYYAIEAGSVLEDQSFFKSGSPSGGNTWSLKGNKNADNHNNPPVMGTTDYVPIVFVTDDQERMRITADGVIQFNGNLDVEGSAVIQQNLTVNQNVFLNTTVGTVDINGPTTIGGPDMNQAIFTGPVQMDKTLDVSLDAALDGTMDVMLSTTLLGTLNVDAATALDSDLTVQANTEINDDLKVIGASDLTGTLKVLSNTGLLGTLNVDAASRFRSTALIDGVANLNNTLSVNNLSNTMLSGDLTIDGVSSLSNKLLLETSTTGPTYGFGDVVSDDGYVAILKNVENNNGDGIKIMLGKNRSQYALDVNNLPADVRATVLGTTSAASEQMKNLIKCGVPNKLGILQDVVIQGGLNDAKLALGAAIGLTNGLIDILNMELGLPFNVSAPLNTGLQGLANLTTSGFNIAIENAADFPINTVNAALGSFDLTAPINTVLDPFQNLTVGVPAANIWNGFSLEIIPGIPEICDPTGVTDICTPAVPAVVLSIPGFGFPGISLPPVTLLPDLPSVKLPSVPNVDVPDVNIDVPDLPELIVPAVPSLDFTSLGIPTIDILSLEFWEIPNICLTESGGSTPLNNDNEFLTFTDKDNNKMGSVKAVSVTDWSKKYLNPMFLSGLRAAITESKTDKLHGKYHFKQKVNEALLAYANMGVEYRSGNGDYAEWLERVDHKETIQPGDIVGVIGGKVTKDVKGAEQIMVVSHHPIVLGNMPKDADLSNGNSIAFIGQVPVKVLGPVESGDYIVAVETTPGYGVAINPNSMSIDNYERVVGRSWENDPYDGPKMVLALIGVKSGDFDNVFKGFENKFSNNESRLSSVEDKIAAISDRLSININK